MDACCCLASARRSGNASLLGAHDPPSLSEDFVFLRGDGMTAGRLAQKRLTRSPDALGYSTTDYVR
jgi:hypothetical protein